MRHIDKCIAWTTSILWLYHFLVYIIIDRGLIIIRFGLNSLFLIMHLDLSALVIKNSPGLLIERSGAHQLSWYLLFGTSYVYHSGCSFLESMCLSYFILRFLFWIFILKKLHLMKVRIRILVIQRWDLFFQLESKCLSWSFSRGVPWSRWRTNTGC